MPKFTVITITFNNRDGLRRTATSIQNQNYTDFEWIIIDGASTDGTADDFNLFTHVKIISEPDSGIYDAMNKGIAHSTGDYVIFMNAGDSFASNDVLEKVAKDSILDADFIYGDSIEDNHLKHARHHSKIKWGMFTHHQAMFYNLRTLGNVRYNTDYQIAADYDLTYKFLKLAKRVIYIPIPICIFETGGVSQRNADLGRNEQFLSRQKNKCVTPFINHAIYYAQKMRYMARQKCPKLYWALFRV